MTETKITLEEYQALVATRITTEEWEGIIKRYIPDFKVELDRSKDDSIVKVKMKAYIDCPPHGIRSGLGASFTEEAIRYTTAEITDYNSRMMVASVLERLVRSLRDVPAPASGAFLITETVAGEVNE